MGGGKNSSSYDAASDSFKYDANIRSTRLSSAGITASTPLHQLFPEKQITNAMNPKGIVVRESRYSEEHPHVVSIVLGLDVTGSMQTVPKEFLIDGMPTIMGGIIQSGIEDPQVLFLGIGDHEYDKAPLQVGQFESSDELLDKWLTSVWLEGRGGGNAGESYLLAWYFAARHTVLDSFEKDGKKGYLFTIGDEPTLPMVSADALRNIMGDGQYNDYTAKELLELAQKTYHVYHFHVLETATGSRAETVVGWKKLMGENCIPVPSHKDIPAIMALLILKGEGKSNITTETTTDNPTVKSVEPTSDIPNML